MTTYSYTSPLNDSEMYALTEALEMMAADFDRELKDGPRVPFFAWRQYLKEIQDRLPECNPSGIKNAPRRPTGLLAGTLGRSNMTSTSYTLVLNDGEMHALTEGLRMIAARFDRGAKDRPRAHFPEWWEDVTRIRNRLSSNSRLTSAYFP